VNSIASEGPRLEARRRSHSSAPPFQHGEAEESFGEALRIGKTNYQDETPVETRVPTLGASD